MKYRIGDTYINDDTVTEPPDGAIPLSDAEWDNRRPSSGQPPVPQVPEAVSMRQARLALLGAGLLAAVDSAVASMPGTAGEAARIEWEYAAYVERNSPLVAGLTSALGLTEAQLDQLFTTAAAL